MAGRETASSDPDRGSMTDSYDANGNVTESVDALGSPDSDCEPALYERLASEPNGSPLAVAACDSGQHVSRRNDS